MVEAHTPTPPAAAPVEVTSTLPAIAADGIECPQHVGIVGLGLIGDVGGVQTAQRKKMLRVSSHSIEYVLHACGSHAGQHDFGNLCRYSAFNYCIEILFVIFTVDVSVRIDKSHGYWTPNLAFTLSVRSSLSLLNSCVLTSKT